MSKQNWSDDKLLERLINNKTDRSCWDIIRILRKRPTEELFAKCVALTQSGDPKIRKKSIDILAQLGRPPRPFLKETLKICFDLLDIETDPNVLMASLYAIGHNNRDMDKEQIDKACSFVHNKNRVVKEGLVFALLGINHVTAIEALIKLSSDKSSQVRDWATFGLGTQIERNNKKIREALWERVNDKHQCTRLEAIVGLAKRKDSRIKDIIKRELIGGEYGTLLFEAIIETQDKEFLPLLEQELDAINGDETIQPWWESHLKRCIEDLSKLTGERRMTE